MKKFFVQLVIIFVLFNNVFFNILPLPSFFSYWDELLELSIIAVSIIVLLKNKTPIKKNYFFMYLVIVVMISIGLLGNFIFEYVSGYSHIIKDVVGFCKFPLAFIFLKNLDYDEKISEYITDGFMKVIRLIVIAIFFFGIISIFKDIGMSQNEIRNGIRPYMFMFSHPTYLVLSSLFMLVLIDSYSFKKDKNQIVYELMLILIILLTMRTKGVVIAALYLFIRYFGKAFKKYKVLYYIGGAGIALTAALDKILLYVSYSSSPREALYKGSLTLLKTCFPFGSGFASFASHISAVSNSLVYDFIHIPYYWVESGNELSVLGDAGLAYYIGQFGIVGSVLFVMLIINIYKISIQKVDNKLPINIFWLYVLVALTTESILINSGIELVLMLLLICGLNKKSGEICEESSDHQREVLA